MKTSRLEKFLINRNLLESFKHNLKLYRKETYEEYANRFSDTHGAIDRGFMWSGTHEGFDFWENIAFEWYSCLKNNII